MGRSVTTLIGQTVERANGLLWVCVWRVRHLHAQQLLPWKPSLFDQNHQSKAAVIDSVAEELGGLDGLINNLGPGDGIRFLNLDIETWARTLEVNLNGAFECLLAAARRMVNAGTGGRIVAVISSHEIQPQVGAAA
jgi:NAD(P)-dependent dehydrogenase (short-subunit alcohol dehydrogenase family)